MQRRTAMGPHRILVDHRRQLTQAGLHTGELPPIVGNEHPLPFAVLMGVEEHRRFLANGTRAQKVVQPVQQL